MANSDYKTLMLHKHRIEYTYDCFECKINGRSQTMTCRGILQPLDYIEPYEIEIRVTSRLAPRVCIKNPKVPYNKDIHMFKNGNLCLFYPRDMLWNSSTSITEYTIPWIIEWILYYELYKISGIWEGPAAPHRIIE